MISRQVHVTGPTLGYMVDKENSKYEYEYIVIHILRLSYCFFQSTEK